MSDDHFEPHQSCYALHPTESWVRGVVSEVLDVPTRGGLKEKRFNVTVTLDAKNLPGVNGSNNKLDRLPLQALHHVVTGGVQAEAPAAGAGSGEEGGSPTAAAADTNEEEQFDDLLHMSYLHDSTLLAQVRKRYFQNLIYTHIGPIVLALNPYDFTLPNYVDSNMPRYIAEGDTVYSSGSQLLPHAWSTAHLAYYSMLNDLENQSVIVSGESGAGKTETAKIVVKYLGFVSTDAANEDEKAEAASVTKRVNLTSPILEAFGNAKTRFNDNSSRFGKFMKVHFSGGGRGVMMGASMEVYLLEKSRIISHGPEERGYHTFYQLVANGAAGNAESGERKGALRDKLHLADATQYPSLSVGKAVKINGVDDGQDFDDVLAAMDAVGLAESEQSSVWMTIAGVLHALKMKFEAVSQDESQIADDSRNKELAILQELWQIDADKLVQELTTTTTTVRSDTFTKKLRLNEAVDYRDSICKALYESLFLWLVARINDLIAPPDSTSSGDASWIALLDIFGFENFAHGNRFEQLCINLANETLQNHYNSIIFTRDMEECQAENINTESVSFYDNQPCLDLISGHNFALCGPGSTGKATSRISILSLLDEECSLANATDLTFCEKLATNFMGGGLTSPRGKTAGAASPTPASPASPTPQLAKQGGAAPNTFDHDGHPNFMKPKTSRNTFVIRHYAGDVTYTVDGFKKSNLDSTKEELKDVFRNSGDPFIAQLLTASDTAAASSTTPRKAGGKGGRGKSTVAGFFKTQLIALMSEINSTHPHWIRCVKPHSAKKPRMFHGAEVMTQLRSAGVLETVRIRQQSFAVRLPFAEFAREYLILGRRMPHVDGGAAGSPTATAPISSKDDPKTICRAILDRANLNADSLAQIGKTKVFLRTEAFYSLSGLRHKRKGGCTTVVAAFLRGRIAAWRVACLVKNQQLKAVQAWLYFRPSHQVLRERELKAREAYLLVTFRSLLVLQSEEHKVREVTLEAEEAAAFDAIVAEHRAGLVHLQEEWLAAKAVKDEGDRLAVEEEEKATRRAIIGEDAAVAAWLHAAHAHAVGEDEQRQAILTEEAADAQRFSGAHEEIRAAVAKLKRERLITQLKETEGLECEIRRQSLEPEAHREFRHLVFSHRMQFAEALLREELAADAERGAEALQAREQAGWALLEEAWWQAKRARDAQARLHCRRVEKDHREQLALEWLQTLMVELEEQEHLRQDAEARTFAREEQEAFEEEERAHLAREKRRAQQLAELEAHRAKAQYVWRLAKEEAKAKERERQRHEEELAAKMAEHAAAAEVFRGFREVEAQRRHRLAAKSKSDNNNNNNSSSALAVGGAASSSSGGASKSSSTSGFSRVAGRAGRFSNMHFATSPSSSTPQQGRRSASPNSIYASPTAAAAAAARSRSRSPNAAATARGPSSASAASQQQRRVNPGAVDSRHLVAHLGSLTGEAFDHQRRAALPITIVEESKFTARSSSYNNNNGASPPSYHHHTAALSSPRSHSPFNNGGAHRAVPHIRGMPAVHVSNHSPQQQRPNLVTSIDPFDSNWAPPDPRHAYLPDGGVVCTDIVEVPVDDSDGVPHRRQMGRHSPPSSTPAGSMQQRSASPSTRSTAVAAPHEMAALSPAPKKPATSPVAAKDDPLL